MTEPVGPDRAEAMGRRLARTATRAGIHHEGVQLLLRAYTAAMEPRRARIAEDHHPDYLHPARTALILLDDAGLRDPTTLAAAALAETRDRTLAVPDEIAASVDAGVAEQLARLPFPDRDGDRLLESLLGLTPELAALAVAERLDHARHLHLRDRDEWAEYHAVTRDAYAPVAARANRALGSRLEWWCATFQQRFLIE